MAHSRLLRYYRRSVINWPFPRSGAFTPCFTSIFSHPYRETITHGPNYQRPLPDLVDGEEEYSVEKILDSRKFGRRRHLQYLVKWEGYPDSDNMWVDKDDVFADDKVREFKASNPAKETHIRSLSSAKFPYPSAQHPLSSTTPTRYSIHVLQWIRPCPRISCWSV
jgi:hypothetical protein